MATAAEHYMDIDYPIVLSKISDEEGGGWAAEHLDLKGCLADGETQEEAIANLGVSRRIWIETALKRKITIPTPSLNHDDTDEYSGKFTLRMPKFLHKNLTLESKKQGVSLNQFILSLLSYKMGVEEGLDKVVKQIENTQPKISITFDQHKGKKLELPSEDMPLWTERALLDDGFNMSNRLTRQARSNRL